MNNHLSKYHEQAAVDTHFNTEDRENVNQKFILPSSPGICPPDYSVHNTYDDIVQIDGNDSSDMRKGTILRS